LTRKCLIVAERCWFVISNELVPDRVFQFGRKKVSIRFASRYRITNRIDSNRKLECCSAGSCRVLDRQPGVQQCVETGREDVQVRRVQLRRAAKHRRQLSPARCPARYCISRTQRPYTTTFYPLDAVLLSPIVLVFAILETFIYLSVPYCYVCTSFRLILYFNS